MRPVGLKAKNSHHRVGNGLNDGKAIMREQEFDALVKLKQGDPKSPANRAARLVLVNGMSQAEAMRETGATRSTVCDAVKRWSDANVLIREAYGLDCTPN